jgi:hypothetical protein
VLDPVYLEYITENKNGVFNSFYPEMSMEGRQVARIKGNLRRGIDSSIQLLSCRIPITRTISGDTAREVQRQRGRVVAYYADAT